MNISIATMTNVEKKIFIEFNGEDYTICIRGEYDINTINDIVCNIKLFSIPYAVFVNSTGLIGDAEYKASFVDEFDTIVKAQEYVSDHGGHLFYNVELYKDKYYVFSKPNKIHNPRIYVVSMYDYDANTEHGVWIDCKGKKVKSIKAEIEEMLSSSPTAQIAKNYTPTDYSIHLYEGFLNISLDEQTPIEDIVKITKGIVKHGLAYSVFNNVFDDICLYKFEDSYKGTYADKADYVEEILEEYGINKKLSRINSPLSDITMESFVDINSIVHNMECSGYYHFEFYEGSYYIFNQQY